MCDNNFKEIISSPKGSVVRCHDRSQFQVGFGNVLLRFNYEQLERFQLFLRETNPHDLDRLKVQPSGKILISSSEAVGGYAFDDEEFIEFRELVITALAMIEMEEEWYRILKLDR